MITLQSSPIDAIARVIPAANRPQDLELSPVRMTIDTGTGHRVTGFEVTDIDEWYLKLMPGFGATRHQYVPKDDWTYTATAAGDFTVNPTMNIITTTGVTMEHDLTHSSAGLGTTAEGGYITVSGLNPATGKAIEAYVDLHADGSKVDFLIARTLGTYGAFHVVGYSLQRKGNKVYSYTIRSETSRGIGIVDLIYENPVVGYHYTNQYFSAAARNPVVSYNSYKLDGQRATPNNWRDDQLTLSSKSAPIDNSIVRVTVNNATIKKLAIIETDDFYCYYSIPDYRAGVWTVPSLRKKAVTTDGRVKSPMVVEIPWILDPKETISVLIDETPAVIDEVIGNQIRLKKPVGLDSTVLVTGVAQDFSYVYRGFTDSDGFHSADLNWNNPYSPLRESKHLYVYARPTSIKHGIWMPKTTEPAIFHTTKPIQSRAVQLIAHVGIPVLEAPTVIDMREPRKFDEAGVWHPDRSFEGPAYPATGAVVISVPNDKIDQTYEVAPEAVSAGIVPLVEGYDPQKN